MKRGTKNVLLEREMKIRERERDRGRIREIERKDLGDFSLFITFAYKALL